MKRTRYVLWFLIILALGVGVALWLGYRTGWPGKVKAMLSSLQVKKEEAFSFKEEKRSANPSALKPDLIARIPAYFEGAHAVPKGQIRQKIGMLKP